MKSAFLPDSKVQIYFVEIPEFFDRKGLYTDHNTGKDFADNAQRYAYFCKGALETLKILSWRPDIIHCNDWQTALVPIYLNSIYKDDEFLQGIKTVFTSHNFAYQGIFDKSTLKRIDVDLLNGENNDKLLHNDQLNLIKGAINYSDWITTVSKSYAEEISTNKKFGYGLESLLQDKKDHFSGVINGVDYGVWSPDVDRYLPFKYSGENIQGKEQNKQALLTRVNLPYKENVPVLGMISRVVEQKGYKLLLDVLDSMIDQEFQLVILGTGDKELEKGLNKYEKKYPQKISINTAFDETLAHMIEAGSDMFLMPSAFEPCGMNQLYSLKYGTLPVVFKTGGLADTITEIDLEENSGNGIVFEKFSTKEFIKAVKRGLRYYKKKEIWSALRLRIMNDDFSWEKPTDEYLEIYDTILSK